MSAFFSDIWHNWILTYPWLGMGVALVLLLFLWKQPRRLMKPLAVLAILAGIIFLVKNIIDFTFSSAVMTEKMIDKSIPK
jgi:hypothetical protein